MNDVIFARNEPYGYGMWTPYRSGMELGHILWPSDPGIRRPGDPVDPVTLLYNKLQMSTYVADKRLQWARGLPVFIAV